MACAPSFSHTIANVELIADYVRDLPFYGREKTLGRKVVTGGATLTLACKLCVRARVLTTAHMHLDAGQRH